ncbi:hypothetical protein I544_3670 [Mycobacteroides abscessus subsp. bolletii 103]|nr:hypothetical protein I544_3670 [Mycobacteroides abscessus subsp. bolletii 103]
MFSTNRQLGSDPAVVERDRLDAQKSGKLVCGQVFACHLASCPLAGEQRSFMMREAAYL